MKVNTFLAALLATAGAAFTIPLAEAAPNPTSTSGDLLLGVRASSGFGSTQDYVIDLGQASLFADTTFTLNLSIGIDLAAIFGTDWNTRSDVYWGIVGTKLSSDPNYTLYASRAETTPGVQSTPWARQSNSTQNSTTTKFNSFIGAYNIGDASGTNNPRAIIQNVTDGASYASFTSPANDFTYLPGSIEANFGAGTEGSLLDLYRLTPTSQSAGTVFKGTFQLSDTGDLTYRAVPEPGTFAMVGLGAGLLGLLHHRRRTALS